MEETTSSLKDEIRRMNSNFEELLNKKEVKKFDIPWLARVSKKKAKDGFASVCYINGNSGIKFMKVPIKEGTIMVNGQPHLATTEFMLNYKNKPFLIVPEWNIKPFAPKQDFDKAVEAKETTYGYRLLLNTLKSEQIKQKKALSGGVILLILVALGIGAYFLFGGSL